MINETSLTRRDFLTIGAAAVAAPAILRGADLAREPVRLGHIGTGTRGWDLIRYTGAIPEAIQSEAIAPLPYEERMTASGAEKVFLIGPEYVKTMVASIVKDQDLSRYIL